MGFRLFLPVLLGVLVLSGLCAQAHNNGGPDGEAEEGRGDPAVAERYFLWADQAAAEGRWPEALAALERAADFADVSSDLSYLLALARSHALEAEGGFIQSFSPRPHQGTRPNNRRTVLEAVERALEADRWGRYSPAKARLLEAEQFAALRNYAAALASLEGVPDCADAAALRLAALKGLCGGEPPENGAGAPPSAEFRRRMTEALDRHPRDPRLLRIFFDYARTRNPEPEDQPVMELALRRLPFLLETDPELAWMAAPFIRDTEEARRLIAAYRAGGYGPAGNRNFRPNPRSITAALNLGLIGDEEAVEEFFAPPSAASCLDKDLIIAVAGLLRSEAGRKRFTEKLLAFSGLIAADDDRDGYPDSLVLYRDGVIREYCHDADQDGIAELVVSFDSGGVPQWAEQAMAAERTSAPQDGNRPIALILWERYPSVLRAELEGSVYIPRPGDFQFAPFRFIELAGGGGYSGLPFPERESRFPRLTERTLVSFSVTVQRPGVEFEGALEWIDLDKGVPLRAVEILNGRPVSITEFEQGRPALRRLDLDLDGRMETVRRFRPLEHGGENPLRYQPIVESSESDWDGDGVYETAETFREDGSVVYSWDMDGDGIREYSEVKAGIENHETEGD
jgi:hypothetical protein